MSAKLTKKSPKLPSHKTLRVALTNMSPQVFAILDRLTDAGFEAYLVGGAVRDFLLGLTPKDFDIATNALPEQVKQLFHNCILIGRRFRLAHIRFGREVIEVATFRAQTDKCSEHYQRSHQGMIVCDNVYGTIEEDAQRRDFTINALYYDHRKQVVLDYTKGLPDLKKRVLRLIGEPLTRYQEDPVRMLRALRLAAKLDCTLDKDTAAPITKLAVLFNAISPARLLEEVIKWFNSGSSLKIFTLLQKYQLFPLLFQQTYLALQGPNGPQTNELLRASFHNTDQRIKAGKPTIPAFLYAVLLWEPLQEQLKLSKLNQDSEPLTLAKAIPKVLKLQKKQTMITERMALAIREIWSLQNHLIKRPKHRLHYLLNHKKFRAAYDFLLLRVQAGDPFQEPVLWWQKLQEAAPEERDQILKSYAE